MHEWADFDRQCGRDRVQCDSDRVGSLDVEHFDWRWTTAMGTGKLSNGLTDRFEPKVNDICLVFS